MLEIMSIQRIGNPLRDSHKGVILLDSEDAVKISNALYHMRKEHEEYKELHKQWEAFSEILRYGFIVGYKKEVESDE